MNDVRAVSVNSFLQTTRLVMRPVEESDLPECIQLYADPDVTALFEDGPKTAEETAEYVHMFGIEQLQNYAPFGLYSVFRKEDNVFVGQADLYTIDQKDAGDAEIGFILKKEYQGRKYGTEIAVALKEYVHTLYDQDHPRVKRMVATAHPENIPSWKILEKIGMEFVEQVEKFNGQPRKVYKLEFSKPTDK